MDNIDKMIYTHWSDLEKELGMCLDGLGYMRQYSSRAEFLRISDQFNYILWDIEQPEILSITRTELLSEILERLSLEKSEYIRADVARHPNADQKLLERLSDDESEEVRAAIVKNPNVGGSLLEKLSTDVCWSVRANVARNSKTYNRILKKLRKDESIHVRSVVHRRPRIRRICRVSIELGEPKVKKARISKYIKN